MANNNNPPKNIVPFPITGSQVIRPTKQTVPEELQKLDGQPLASVQPDDNVIQLPEVKKTRTNETANSAEFNLHSDGTLMKYLEIPDHPPQCFLVDGAGRQFGVARNPAVADLICNGVNALHLATVMQAAEERAKHAAEHPGGPPPALLLPPD